MARLGQGAPTAPAAFLWPLGLLLGLSAGAAGHLLVPASMATPARIALAAAACVAVWVATLAVVLLHRRRARAALRAAGLDAIAGLDRAAFARRIAAAYRQRGHYVQHGGRGLAGIGFDLVLRHDRRVELVACRHGGSGRTELRTLRALWARVQEHRAHAARVLCVQGFSAEAVAFAAGKPLELVAGSELAELLDDAQAADAAATGPTEAAHAGAPACPRCNGPMVPRSGADGTPQLGCLDHPACLGARPA
ncbi:restriction endonuclease [Coralloluteibacterium stylophorae]|uniref:Restriction endonuclease n=1 Tax=Coralloluteibacterium stylophorae TaxID=1776034 RepID=A0A8J7VXA2_9GAMM|nr:restriction endonuclease [Coralloluteibacterium stylophorae]MBS7457502.1 restriction endonuclease [Coralloluteibacterium stylophorae]